jgi:hypothetical protein
MLYCLLHIDDVNLLGDSINTIKENSKTLLEASGDIGLEINAEKTKYMIMSRHPNSGQNQNIRIANGTHGGGERCLQGFGWEARRQKTTGKT